MLFRSHSIQMLPRTNEVSGRPGFSFRERLIVYPLYIATVLIVFNQRIGIDDPEGFNVLTLLLRCDVWFGFAAGFCLLLKPKLILPARDTSRTAIIVVWVAPIMSFLSCIFASLVSEIRFHALYTVFGLVDFLRIIVCTLLGILVFRLAKQSARFALGMMFLLTWTPLLNIFALAFTSVTSINNIAGFNSEASHVDVGLGFFSFGDRFQGLGSNPDILVTQACIAIALLLPRIFQKDGETLGKRIFLSVYVVGLLISIAPTGTRTAIFVLVVVAFGCVWLRFRVKDFVVGAGAIARVLILLVAGSLLASSLGLTNTLLERILYEDDGRLVLWSYYSSLMFENPIGYGFGFEDIVDTDVLSTNHRLPPHNALLQQGLYGGIAGLLICLFILGKIGNFIALQRRVAIGHGMSVPLQGIVLGLSAILAVSMFGGLLSAEYDFGILTALLFAFGVPVVSVRRPRHMRRGRPQQLLWQQSAS